MDYLRRALDSENRLLVNELADLRLKTSAVTETAIDIPMPTDLILDSIEMNIPEPIALNDFWSQSRIRQRNQNYKKKSRTVQDLHEVLFIILVHYTYKILIHYA